jgi:predicted nucleic acid-binding protein
VAVAGWVLDNSAAVLAARNPVIGQELAQLRDLLFVCPIGELEQLYSAQSAADYDVLKGDIHASFDIIAAPLDIFDRALGLQRDLAHHHGMWHRIPIPDLLIAETALHHGLGVITVDADFQRIAEVRPLVVRLLKH